MARMRKKRMRVEFWWGYLFRNVQLVHQEGHWRITLRNVGRFVVRMK
jgi:hypothetical protein